MSEIDSDFLRQLQEAFVIEAREQLQSFMTSVIALESCNDDEEKHSLAESILHDLHSMKGNSRAAGITTVETVCQALESALLSLRRKKELLKPEAADVFHSAIDLLDDSINKIESGQADYLPKKFAEILHRLKMLDERQRLAMEAAALAAGSEPPLGSPPSPAGGITPQVGSSELPAGFDALPTGSAALPTGSLPAGSTSLPAGSSAQQPDAQVNITTTFSSSLSEQSADIDANRPSAISLSTGGDVAASQFPEQASAKNDTSSPGTKSGKTQTSPEKPVSTRIALWKLDKMLRESEEMLILKQISEQHLEDVRDMKVFSKQIAAQNAQLNGWLSSSKLKAGESVPEKDLLAMADSLKSILKNFDQTITNKMRRQQTEQRLCFNMVDGFIDSVKSLLMQDFSTLLSVVPKVVRDLSRELRKEVDLEIYGSEIEIDRRILEEIKDPLIHLVRNCLDHGLETSEERIAKGKSPRASLSIGARQDESGNVQLRISDDGKGINVEKLRAAAVREGAINAEQAQRLSESESIELMYRSSISTSEKVTEISGRGIGMAIVRERIHELGGRVIVETQPDKGTTFVLQLPTKLSTFRGIQVMVGNQSYIIPTLHVNYAGRILRSEIKQSGSRNTITVNDQLTSVQTLSDVLQVKTTKEFKTKATRNYQQLLVLENGDRRAGFLVDEILHEHEVLVRGLSYPLVRVANVAGATILGSGEVVPVLNIADLMETSSKASWADESLTNQLREESNRMRKLAELPVFLVDRHLTSLVMLKALLVSEGYVVHTFDSNESALEGLDNDVPLILLKSSELPETQESGLAYWIRKDLRLKDLPIVFFGSYGAGEGETYSLNQGGNAYFSKIDFDRKQILQLIEKLI